MREGKKGEHQDATQSRVTAVSVGLFSYVPGSPFHRTFVFHSLGIYPLRWVGSTSLHASSVRHLHGLMKFTVVGRPYESMEQHISKTTQWN